jgi:pyruvate/2-oxoglutarate dehydrogenase complex dihydrolipoamide dehydrogenase (E3) component
MMRALKWIRIPEGPVVDENYMTSIEGVFAAGNGLNVHDLADFAAHQGGKAGEGAARYIQNGKNEGNRQSVPLPVRMSAMSYQVSCIQLRFTAGH